MRSSPESGAESLRPIDGTGWSISCPESEGKAKFHRFCANVPEKQPTVPASNQKLLTAEVAEIAERANSFGGPGGCGAFCAEKLLPAEAPSNAERANFFPGT
jgi:hypothetical protein